jgi:hypothetical protein
VLLEITQDYNKVHPDLFEAYSKNLLASVDNILSSNNASDKYFDLQVQFEANLSRFAAFKAYHATNAIKDAIGDPEKQRKILNKFNSYQAAEYNTATARIRSAKQWIDFNSDPVSNELYPNIKWLPSRSAFKREIHKLYYNRVWAKSDPFWINNQPGNLWNCKCDWEETDEPVSGLIEKEGDIKPHNGLEGNPAITGQIFTDNSTYFRLIEKPVEIRQINTVINNNLENKLKLIRNELEINHPNFNSTIELSRKGIKEYLNQPHENYYIKGVSLTHIKSIIENSEFLGKLKKKEITDNFESYLFETKIKEKKSWIIVREYVNPKVCSIYSISDSEKITGFIEKN